MNNLKSTISQVIEENLISTEWSDSVNTEDLSLQGLSGVTSIDVIGTVTSADRSGKAKTTQSMKVLKIDDISSNFTGFTTTTGGQIVGLTTFSLKNKGFPLFYREFDSTVEKNFTLSDDRFTFENHNFQSGQQLQYKISDSIKAASGIATTVVENTFSYPTASTTLDSPIDSFDSIVRTFDAN